MESLSVKSPVSRHKYDFEELVVLGDVEGRGAEVELVGEHPHRPHVHFLIVAVALHDFRGEVQGRPTER